MQAGGADGAGEELPGLVRRPVKLEPPPGHPAAAIWTILRAMSSGDST